MMNNNEMFKLANKFGSRVRVMANDSCFEFWTDGLEKFAEAYHLAKCANNAPIGYVSEWEGDVSDTNNFIFVEKLDELDDSTNWIPVFAAPQPSDADEKIELSDERENYASDIENLLTFYHADSLINLIRAQEKHVERLQNKLVKFNSTINPVMPNPRGF